jgi:hypothetical protein
VGSANCKRRSGYGCGRTSGEEHEKIAQRDFHGKRSISLSFVKGKGKNPVQQAGFLAGVNIPERISLLHYLSSQKGWRVSHHEVSRTVHF